MSEFLSKLAAPIAGGNPFGADVNHDPVYERLKGEIGKLGDIDVDVVEELSIEVLAEKSKDIRAMAWLAYASLRKGDLGRLADVVGLLVDCCEGSFEQVYPLREGAKLAALRWLAEPRFTSQCPKTEAVESDAPHIGRMKEALVRLKPVLEKKFPSTGAPFPSLFYKRVMEWDKAVSVLIQSRVKEDNAAQSVDKPADRAVSTIVDKSAGNESGAGGHPRPAAEPNGKANGHATVVLKLTHNEYNEIVSCIGRMETLLKKFG